MPRRTVIVLPTSWARARRLQLPEGVPEGVKLHPDTPTVLVALPLNSDLTAIRDWTRENLPNGRRVRVHARFTFDVRAVRIDRRFDGYLFQFDSVHEAVLFKLRWYDGPVEFDVEPTIPPRHERVAPVRRCGLADDVTCPKLRGRIDPIPFLAADRAPEFCPGLC